MISPVDVVRRLFAAIEERDLDGVLRCYHDAVEINETPSLPYGGVYRGHDGALRHVRAFVATWGPYQSVGQQPLKAVFAQSDDTAIAVFQHLAVDPVHGERLDGPEVGVYRIRDDKIVRSQMFHFDPAALTRFLQTAKA